MSISEIAKELGLSNNAIQVRYKKIKKAGLIKLSFLPAFLPQYISGKSKTHRMQILIKATSQEIQRIIKFIQELTLNEVAQINCWEVIGHYNIFVSIISENPIDLHLMHDKIQNQPGVLEVKESILVNLLDSYYRLNLDHLVGEKLDG